jgi:hypothetical protein
MMYVKVSNMCCCTDPLAVSPKMQSPYSFTCMDFFSNQSLIQVVVGTNWQTSYFDFRNYCLYCNHTTSTEFQQAILTNTSVPYFWRHESSVCNQNPAILSSLYTPYFDRIKSSNSSLTSLSPTNLNDFLSFTQLRTLTSNFIGEKAQSDLFYTCMFLDTQIYGISGDIWETSIAPVRYQGMWIIDLIIRVTLMLVIIILVWIPRIKHWVIVAPKLKEVTGLQIFLRGFSALQSQALICATLSLFVGMFEDFIFLQTTPTGYRSLNGVFRIISCFLVCLGSFLLLLSWVNIVHAATHMVYSPVLPMRYLAATAAVYFFIVVFALSGIIVYATTSTALKVFATGILMFIAAFLSIIIMLGFSIYGMRILWLFRAGRTKAEVLHLRVTRLILLSNFSWALAVAWLIVLALTFSAPSTINTFFVVFNVQFVDAAAMLMIITHMIIIFRYDLFVKCYQICKKFSKEPTNEA